MSGGGAGVDAVGVVGAGNMGGQFARHLAAAGRRVLVRDVDPVRVADAVAGGCEAADVPSMLAGAVDVVVLSLPSEGALAAVVDEVVASPLSSPPPVLVETSTLGLGAKESARARLADVGVTLLDCPVSGTGAQARERDVVVYASGPGDDVERCRSALLAFARSVRHVGPFGAGSKIKYLANLLVGIHNSAAAEMLVLAERAGMDPAVVLETVADGAGQSRMLEVRGPAMAAHDYTPTFGVRVFRKDLRIIAAFAADTGSPTPLLDVVSRLYAEAEDRGWGDHDAAAVHAVYLGMTNPDAAPY